MYKFVIYKDTGGMCHNLGGLSKIINYAKKN